MEKLTPVIILEEIKKGSTDQEIINMIEEYGQDQYEMGSENALYN